MSAAASSQVSLTEAQALVGVRSLMAEASRRGADRSVAGRHVAVVLLDSSVEAALAVCLGRFGDSASERDTLADLHKRLSNSTKGSLPGWRDVSRLRRARNLAHHHQIPVDPEALPFFGPVAEYVDAAVRSTFGIRLSDVVLADSIEDPVVRASVAEAEKAIETGSVVRGIGALSRAFTEASRCMSGLTARPGIAPHDNLGFGRAIESAVKPLRDTTVALMFASDGAEYLWFDTLRNASRLNGETPASLDDVRRSLHFVVGWIERAEAYARAHAALTERERAQFAPAAPSSSRIDGRPEWDAPPEVEVQPPYVEVAGRIRWGSGDDSAHDRWHVAISRAVCAVPWQTVAPISDVVQRVWSNEVGLRWNAGVLEPQAIADQVRAVLAAMAEAFGSAVHEFGSLCENERLQEEESNRRDEIADSFLGAIATSLGSDSPFSSAAADSTLDGVTLAFGPEIQPIAERLFQERVQLTVGNLFASGRGVEWLVPLNSALEELVSAARSISDLVKQRSARWEQEHRLAADAAALARAEVENLWRA